MPEIDTALMRRLREDDPPRWLEWRLEALLESDAFEQHEALCEECIEMLGTVQSWPDGLYSPHEAQGLLDRVGEIVEEVEESRRPELRVVGSVDESPGRDDVPPERALVTKQGAVAERFDSEPVVAISARFDSEPVPASAVLDIELQTIDPKRRSDPRLVVAVEDSERAERFRALYYRLGAMGNPRSVLVTSATRGEGVSTCAANLALAMAEGAAGSTLLIEASFEAPSIAEMFGFEPRECFGRRLTRQRREPDAPWSVAQLDEPNLRLLAIDGSAASRPALDTRALAEAIGLFSEEYEHIVVDGPAVLDSADAALIARAVDGVVLTLRTGVSSGRAVKEAVERLGPAPILGYVLLDA